MTFSIDLIIRKSIPTQEQLNSHFSFPQVKCFKSSFWCIYLFNSYGIHIMLSGKHLIFFPNNDKIVPEHLQIQLLFPGWYVIYLFIFLFIKKIY